MLNADFIENITKKLSDAVPANLLGVKEDLERNFRAVLQGTFAKLDLVTREEFDAQVGVLAKTRAKLEVMELQIIELEAKLAQQTRQNGG